MKKPKVVVAGHICLDITPMFPQKGAGDDHDTHAPGANPPKGLEIADVLRAGTLTRVDGIDIHTGGAVANTGLAMSIFGVDVRLMGKIGKDPLGSMVMSILRERKADRGMIVSREASTSYSVVIALPGKDRVFLHDPGANDTFRLSDLNMRAIKSARLFHFGYPTLMASMFRNDGEELASMFRAVDGARVLTSLDLASVDENSEAAKANWDRILLKTLPHVDFFMPSYEELAFMLDKPKLERVRERAKDGNVVRALSISSDVEPLAAKAVALGAKIVIVKCGARGFYYRTAGQERIAELEKKNGRRLGGPRGSWANRAGFEKSYVAERVLSATGAGDTAIAAFLSAALKGYEFDSAIQLSAAAGAACCEAYDALGGLRSLGELERKINSGWQKVP